jgi:predicted lipoprotein with Yx(FWY)xxD motif
MKTSVPKILFSLMLGLFICSTLLTEKAAADGANTIGVKIMEKEAVGQYLADSNGMTLYRFTRDEKSISHCIEGCAVNWPPFYSDPSAGVEGCELSNFAAITREDGRKQTTYKAMPLYYFKNDRYPGDTFGDGLGDACFLVTP